jgi:excisionase family DNA binding protein
LEKEMEMTRSAPPLTTHEISLYLNVDLTTVINWCEQGKLQAYKTPGGHRRVQPENLLLFLEQYRMPVPQQFSERMRKVLRVLIVDDEEDVRNVVSRALRKSLPNAQLIEARDGFEAGKLLSDSLPDLVILDLKLPGVDGFRVCANIREDKRFEETKILAVTGQNTPENRKRILDSGADDYLPKPFEVVDLIDRVFDLLAIERKPEK